MNKLIRIKKRLKRTCSNKFSFLIFVFLTISLIFFGYYLFAQVETTPGVLKDYFKVQACPNFTDINDLTMKDQCTGLVWARHELPTYKIANDPAPGYSWQEAKDACAALVPAGLFRLPTAEEMLSLIKYKCDNTDCFAKAVVANVPSFSNGYYWSSSDFNEPVSWSAGLPARDYKRSVNLLNGKADSPVFGQYMKLNAWCVVAINPEIVERKFISVNTSPITNGQQVTGGTLKTIYHRICNTNNDCSALSNTTCESGGGGVSGEPVSFCGDGDCDVSEDCTSCPGDCCAPVAPICGDNFCDSAGGETITSCSQDCTPITSLSCNQQSGSATIAADNCFRAYLNGTEIGKSDLFPSSAISFPDINGNPYNPGPEACNTAWYTPYTYNNLPPFISGNNVIAIEATDYGGPYGLEAQFMCGIGTTATSLLTTNTPVNWRCSPPYERRLDGANDPKDATGKNWYDPLFTVPSSWTAPSSVSSDEWKSYNWDAQHQPIPIPLDGVNRIWSSGSYSGCVENLQATPPLVPPWCNSNKKIFCRINFQGPPSFSCNGTAPDNSTICPGGDTGLTANTNISFVPSCTAGNKCEYTCDPGYSYTPTQGLKAVYYSDLGASDCPPMTIYNEGPINHGWAAGVTNNIIYQGSQGNWKGCWGNGVLVHEELSGYVYAPVSGAYNFNIYADDYGVLTVNGQSCTYDTPGPSYPAGGCSVSSTLEQGQWYPISISYKNRTGTNDLHLSWTKPGGTNETIPLNYLSNPSSGSCVAVSSDKAITSFVFNGIIPQTIVINETAHTITATVPSGTIVTALVPTIAISAGASVSLASGVVNNFKTPATYTVTAADGTTQAYVVTVVTLGKLVFVTSETWTGNLGGITGLNGANAKCQAEADTKGVGGTFKAWISDATNQPSSTFTHSTNPYYLVAGVKVADNWTDLTDGTLDHAINVDINGATVSTVSNNVWTNANIAGNKLGGSSPYHCDSWANGANSQTGERGDTSSAGSFWTVSGYAYCDAIKSLYCFEQ